MSMGCVHTHWKRPTIEKCGSLNHIQNVVDKIGEDNQNFEIFGQVISQVPAPGLEHDKNLNTMGLKYIIK
jgi:hypothetical protein